MSHRSLSLFDLLLIFFMRALDFRSLFVASVHHVLYRTCFFGLLSAWPVSVCLCEFFPWATALLGKTPSNKRRHSVLSLRILHSLSLSLFPSLFSLLSTSHLSVSDVNLFSSAASPQIHSQLGPTNCESILDLQLGPALFLPVASLYSTHNRAEVFFLS